MKTKQTLSTIAALAILLLSAASTGYSQTVDARLSAREAYVGMPIVLQISITNASDYQAPKTPNIDGCDVQSAGSTSQSSQITIINGRRSESRSITMQYLITPRREGTFTIPPITLNIDGRDQKTQAMRFVATKSETGDLLFVEIDGGKDKVFVGQPLELTLKIWVKPMVDREQNVKLSKANMWQLISRHTSWGSFGDRLKEMAKNNQRPGGREVLRDDGEGNERAYYLYEIEATVYPKRPGKIDADDVQVAVNYPTALGRARDPFESFFKDSPFGRDPLGGSSRLSQMMNDDFFSSPFSNRISVSSTRPIVGTATVDSTEVIPIPTANRPDDYRGAVGRYKIITQASPTSVSAGEPITLNIGILGTGPMELVQAPPLSTLPSLTADFKVADQSLAGFVEDDTKVFPTTIRPRREGITEIPPIPFSFFDPETESFETVMSEPISITVDKSESLALDSIVSNARRSSGRGDNRVAAASSTLEPKFTNNESASVLVSQSPSKSYPWWLTLVVLPPFVWLASLLIFNRNWFISRLPSIKSSAARCRVAIERANSREQFENALIQYISHRTGRTGLRTQSSVGVLRTSGLSQCADEVESFFQSNDHSAFNGTKERSHLELQQTASELMDRMEASFASLKKSQVWRSTSRSQSAAVGKNRRIRRVQSVSQNTAILAIAGLLAMSATQVLASNSLSGGDKTESVAVAEIHDHVQLTETQQQLIFQEAGEIYRRASEIEETETAEANDLFTTAAVKYQLLVDSGIRNSDLYMNLGNAYLRSNQLGHAIVNYERARQLDPGNRQLKVNLELANSLVKGQDTTSGVATGATNVVSRFVASIVDHLRTGNETLINFIGMQAMVWLLVISSLLFWGLLTASAIGYRFPVRRWAIVPLLILMFSVTSYGLSVSSTSNDASGVIVANQVTLHSGDGEQFESLLTLESAQGHRVKILTQRGKWTQVSTLSGHTGWLKSDDVIDVNAAT